MNALFFTRLYLVGAALANTYILTIIYDIVENNNEILENNNQMLYEILNSKK
jgi:hypothetical protein